MTHRLRFIACALLAGGLHATAHAKLVEQQFDLPVRVTNAWGKVVEQPIRVTLFLDDATPAPRPVLLLNHGRAVEATARAALGPPGVVAAINFAGGGGGDPKGHPEQPCSPAALKRLFSGYGQTAHMPMLWAYTENDRFFGPRLPREWFDAFREAGGNAEFKQFPPHGDDGHQLFAKFPQVWQPVVAEFLRRQGFDIKD